MHFNIVHPPTSWSSQWSLSFWIFHFFGLRNNIYLQNKVISLASNPQPGGPGPCVYVPQWQSGRHRIPSSWPSTTRRATVEV
jgi:hypothetical protein